MSWLLNLYQTYESNLDRVGKIETKHNDQEYTLLPVSHTTQNAHIEVQVTEDGEYHSARVIDKEDASTLIPCTEDSASRAGSKIAPYPLHDKLSYVAGDFVAYGGEIKKEEPFTYYIQQLEKWASSSYGSDKVRSIHQYLRKGRLIQDLINDHILYADSNNRLIDKWDKQHESLSSVRPPIYSVIAGGPESAFVRFNVYSPNDDSLDVWKDQKVYNSFIQFYSHQLGEEDICYVTGDTRPSTDKHANKIRNAADKAKLISANDGSGFTYRGRFSQSKEAACISYEVSQKGHNALKWLINRQGKIIDGRVFLVWGNDELDLPSPSEDSFDIDPDAVVVKEYKSFTNEQLATELAKALSGFRNSLSTANKDMNVNIMILDSATTGRMAVLYYRNMDKEMYLNRLTKWHSSCVWIHSYRKNNNGEFIRFYGAPATKDIAFAAYGPRADDKIIKGLMERMLPCIVDEREVPTDIVNNVFRRASNPVSMEKWEWEKTLSIACALINKKEGYTVALDLDNNDRDYLFGRLLAVADILEKRMLGYEETRASNAIRYMNAYSTHPARTWQTIQASLQPHQARLGTRYKYVSDYAGIIDEILSRIPFDKFNNNPLSHTYLLGFSSQRHELTQAKDKSKADAEEASI
ncbi:type I-C CRISPR-associated protein Cas8c/Csd1 [Paenibacillus sp. YIM B09110]|uniref:type I-C CRISPR-associated protein Cas8c/Csd1 n=1 Tax=Paenibacillus sp. YIM B09110 TaxID=3126102 RepID=UPI00301C8327